MGQLIEKARLKFKTLFVPASNLEVEVAAVEVHMVRWASMTSYGYLTSQAEAFVDLERAKGFATSLQNAHKLLKTPTP